MRLAQVVTLTIVLSAVAGAFGVWGGAEYVRMRPPQPLALHDVLHGGLRLTPEQRERIEVLEGDYAARRKVLETEIRAANAQLALAYQQSHAFTPKTQAAIDRFHRAMDALQKETLMHVIAMRGVLTKDQTGAFDATVVRLLTAPSA